MSKGHVFHSCIYYFFNAQIAKVYANLIDIILILQHNWWMFENIQVHVWKNFIFSNIYLFIYFYIYLCKLQ